MSAIGTKRTTTLALPCATKCQFASELMHFNLVTSINTEYALHNFTLPALATDYVLTPVVATYFSVR